MVPIVNAPITIVQNETFTGLNTVSSAVSIADWLSESPDFTLAVTVSGCFAGTVLISVDDSQDGFVADIQHVVQFNVTGPVNPGTYVGYSFRKREIPSLRCGVQGATCRLMVTSASSQASVTLSCEIK